MWEKRVRPVFLRRGIDREIVDLEFLGVCDVSCFYGDWNSAVSLCLGFVLFCFKSTPIEA
jgi:hypothetical protein